MMTLGLITSFIITFALPTLLNFTPTKTWQLKNEGSKLLNYRNLSLNYQTPIFIVIIVIGLSLYGIIKLEVENSFINYLEKN